MTNFIAISLVHAYILYLISQSKLMKFDNNKIILFQTSSSTDLLSKANYS